MGEARHIEHPPNAPADTVPEGYYLTGVFVRPDCRRMGLGTALTETLAAQRAPLGS
jgi:ribosomal protein S18 acetylase RimI-like enzyme